MENFNWDDIAKLFLVGAFPWISEFKKLEIHFKTDGVNLSAIYNFFASLFACSLFVYSYYASPYQLLWLPSWGAFIFIAVVLVVAYFIIFFLGMKKVNEGKSKPLVIINFVLYITIFCSLTVGFAKVKLFKDYYIMSGRVLDAGTKTPVRDADVMLMAGGSAEAMQTVTNRSGEFSFFIDRPLFNKIDKVQVNATNYITWDKTFLGESSKFSYTEKILLEK
ncbi:MAG: carboxypeptidase-like regulatory domain-containing protein [Chitinophagaceae bacterium]